jgi:hypothetical protein
MRPLSAILFPGSGGVSPGLKPGACAAGFSVIKANIWKRTRVRPDISEWHGVQSHFSRFPRSFLLDIIIILLDRRGRMVLRGAAAAHGAVRDVPSELPDLVGVAAAAETLQAAAMLSVGITRSPFDSPC